MKSSSHTEEIPVNISEIIIRIVDESGNELYRSEGLDRSRNHDSMPTRHGIVAYVEAGWLSIANFARIIDSAEDGNRYTITLGARNAFTSRGATQLAA